MEGERLLNNATLHSPLPVSVMLLRNTDLCFHITRYLATSLKRWVKTQQTRWLWQTFFGYFGYILSFYNVYTFSLQDKSSQNNLEIDVRSRDLLIKLYNLRLDRHFACIRIIPHKKLQTTGVILRKFTTEKHCFLICCSNCKFNVVYIRSQRKSMVFSLHIIQWKY